MSVTKLVGSECEKINHPPVSSFSRCLAYGLKMLCLSCRTTDVPVSATNNKKSLNLNEGIIWPFLCILNSHKLIDHALMCWCSSCKPSVGDGITRGVGHENICEGLLWAPSTRTLQLCWIWMSLPCLAWSLQGCLNSFGRTRFSRIKETWAKA